MAFALLASASGALGQQPAAGTAASAVTGCTAPDAHRFDFWPGDWDVQSRRRDAAGVWRETRNRWRAEAVLGGCTFVDYADGDFGTGPLKGMGTRFFNPRDNMWNITWLSTENPGSLATWRGGFTDRSSAEFFMDVQTPSGRLLSRIKWWDITADAAEWEHALSRDGGSTWQSTWRMTFRRAAPR